MKIYGINNINTTFGNKTKLVTAIQNSAEKYSTAPRKVTAMDKYLFRGYTFSLSFLPKFNQKDINRLFKLEGDEFIFESYEFLIRHLRIPQSLRPPIEITDLGDEIEMAYSYTKNKVEVNSDRKNNSKIYIFGSLRHEIQHFLQNINIFRHEELGNTAVETYSQMSANSIAEGLNEIIDNSELEKLIKLANTDEPRYQVCLALKYLKERNQMEEYQDILNRIKDICKKESVKELTKFRKRVIQEMGYLDKNSRDAKRAEKIFDEFKNNIYYKEDGTIHNGKYQYSVSETEALIAGEMTEAEIKGGLESCFIRNNRLESYKTSKKVSDLDNKEILAQMSEEEKRELKEFKETRDEIANKYNTEEEFIENFTKYIYD